MSSVRQKNSLPLNLVAPGTIWLPLRFMMAGVVSFLAALVWIALKPEVLATYHYNQSVVALTHLVVLGWIASVVMGATYQLVPIALETTLHSQKMARWHFAFHLVGFLGMVWMFSIWDMKQVGHFGSIFAIGIGLFAWNMFRTFKRVEKWDVIGFSIASALSWLVITTLAGLFIASAKCWPQISKLDPIAQMHAHAHLGILGCFVMLTMGVSFKLIPMFALSDIQSPKRAWISIILLNVALAGSVVTIALQSGWKFVFALVGVLAVSAYILEMVAIIKVRKRRELDWGLKTFFIGLFGLAVATLLGAVLAYPSIPLTNFTGQLENVYGYLALFGFISLAILGMMHKIVPFLVWYYSYSREIGKSKVPALSELYSVALQKLSIFTYLAGLAFGSAGILLENGSWVRSAACVMLLGAVFFGTNIALILRHLVAPNIQPLKAPAAPKLAPAAFLLKPASHA